MRKIIRFYVSPCFLIKYYLQRDIKYFAKKYNFAGKILDLGCGQKPYGQFFENSKYVGIDFESYSKSKDSPYKKPDYYFDEKYLEDLKLPFESGIFDNAVSFQVLEHHPEPEIMIRELARITKKDGLILITCPFIYALHEEPNDYQRLTEYKLRELFRKNSCLVIKIKKQGALFSTFSMLANEQLSAFAARSRSHYLLAVVAYLPLLLFQYLSLFLDKIAKSEKVFMNYIILAKKG